MDQCYLRYLSKRSQNSGALALAGASVEVLVADEAHRTAGIKKVHSNKVNERIRNFTLCHDNDAFPAKYRLYQTATPRIYDVSTAKKAGGNWAVRTMDDEAVFGVELYRRSYVDAVKNRWLCDYRIIAFGINDEKAFEQANRLASMARAKDMDSLKTTHYLRGLAFALAMAGATRRAHGDGHRVEIGSCIGFMNTVQKSKTMADNLQTDEVRDWIKKWFETNGVEGTSANYSLKHLDASSNVTARQEALRRLSHGNGDSPEGILNVGIFGEGTDSPALNAVAFLEPRKSPIDVIQAVGRAMRTSHGKKVGYIICPILIPPHADPEQWLSSSGMEEGWKELGQILLALRAHDHRIETELEHLMECYIPAEPAMTRSILAVADQGGIKYYEHEGSPESAPSAVGKVLRDQSTPRKEKFTPLKNRSNRNWKVPEPTQIITGKRVGDNELEIRGDTVRRGKTSDGESGRVDVDKCRAHARNMINKPDIGRPIKHRPDRPKKPPESPGLKLLRLSEATDSTKAIKLNLLERSGLKRNRVERDLNILEDSINEAARHLAEDDLEQVLSEHFHIGALRDGQRRASGCTVASLLLMNAALLHQRIGTAEWVSGIKGLSVAKHATDVIRSIRRDWDRILRHDYKPVLEPAIDVLDVIEDRTARRAGLERALHHIASEAERIAATYADMGMDHAGPLFNRVMGDQKSDGAYFTRPLAAVIAASLALDACGDVDWKDEDEWKANKVVDLACGSGTLLAAVLAEMRRRAREAGASDRQISRLHRIGVEHVFKGLDINPVSLQLAAAQLTIGNTEVRFNNMGLHRMPYGPNTNGSGAAAGTLELLAQREVVDWHEDAVPDAHIESEAIWASSSTTAVIETAVDAVKDARIVIMNPPFTNRAAMGEKYADKVVQQSLRDRVDVLEKRLVKADPDMVGFWDKNAIRPLFVALADHCLRDDGILSMVIPTAALCAPSGENERRLLAARYHIHTIVTCHLPGQIHMSQETNINESIVVARRRTETNADTRFVHLDKFPVDDDEANELCSMLRTSAASGNLGSGWGEISYWPAERMAEGDWSPAVWRSPSLASAALDFGNHADLLPLTELPNVRVHATGQVLRGGFTSAKPGTSGGFPIIKSKGEHGQKSIKSMPDEYWIAKDAKSSSDDILLAKALNRRDRILEKAGHLLVTAGQRLTTARVTAIASHDKFVGNGWMPVTGLSETEAKALAVFLNSTVGRLQLLRIRGKTLPFPTYSAKEGANLRVPDVRNNIQLRDALALCYDETQEEIVPQFRDGECPVRIKWDNAVGRVMEWSSNTLSLYREQLHHEPFVRGLGYNQYTDAPAKHI